jgi:hypothetical protein
LTKELIVVVHGVGVKQAGVSADLLSTSLQNTPEENAVRKRDELSKEGLRTHSTSSSIHWIPSSAWRVWCRNRGST